jgi:putative flippase GtrA
VNAVVSRVLKFNAVGLLGVGVNMGAFAIFREAFHLAYLPATALAVETAVLHNFVWHENFTWKDRAHGGAWKVASRLLRFHAGNGLVSIAGNVLLMRWFVGGLHWNAYAANLIAISLCAAANFVVSEWYVFRKV